MNEWENRLINAAKNGRFLEVQTLLKKFVNPNVKDPETRESALALAIKGGHTGIMKLLLNSGADASAMDVSGTTPLHIAAKANNINAVKLLVLNNAKLNIKTSSGLTPSDFTTYGTVIRKILEDAQKGVMPNYVEASEVPVVPNFAIENAIKEKPKKKKKGKGKKKGGKKKKK